jgi:hypothetical protein
MTLKQALALWQAGQAQIVAIMSMTDERVIMYALVPTGQTLPAEDAVK